MTEVTAGLLLTELTVGLLLTGLTVEVYDVKFQYMLHWTHATRINRVFCPVK